MRIIDFAPPMSGIEGEFNTFRLGPAWSKRVESGEIVILMDKKQCSSMGYAEVTAIHVGKLLEMSTLHARRNHNQIGLDTEGAGERLIANMMRRYGPAKCGHTKTVTVVYLRKLE